MKIIDGLKLKGWQVEIPDCGRDDLPEFFKKMGYKVGAEIGVEKGIFAENICKAGLKLYAIDPWMNYDGYYEKGFNDEAMEENYKEAKNRLASYDCNIIHKTSMEAVKDFKDGSLDFVYIDGNHGFKFVTEDIWEWSKKVRRGGAISGHDYYSSRRPFHMDVKYVLDGYTKAAKLSKWYVLGKRFKDKRDKFRSWFWIKQ